MVRHPLRGSERTIPEDARLSGFALAHAAGASPPTPLTREEWAAQFGATTDDIDVVRTFAREHGLQVMDVSVAAARIRMLQARKT